MENKKNDTTMFLITQLILTYRISLDNISKTFNMDNNELYKELLEYNKDNIIYNALKYVLNHETIYEYKNIQELSRKKVRLFLIKLHMAKTSKAKADLINTLNNDKEILNLRNKNYTDYTNEDFELISRYRLKYALGRTSVSDFFEIPETTLRRKEKKYDDEILIKKLEMLNSYKDFYSDAHLNNQNNLKV